MEKKRINAEEIIEKIFQEDPPTSPEDRDSRVKLLKMEISFFELDRAIENLAKQYNLDFDTLKKRFREATGMIDNPLPCDVLTEKNENYILLILNTHPVVRLLDELEKEHRATVE